MTDDWPLLLIMRVLALVLALVLAALVALIVPSHDNSPFMTAFAVTLVALITALVLLGYAGGWRAAPGPPDSSPNGS
ncbi:MAG: hypothetical protein IT340_23410 [Chloroflexi bacterium]|nr:hypothetical protein [Chloroflexota bacterium]